MHGSTINDSRSRKLAAATLAVSIALGGSVASGLTIQFAPEAGTSAEVIAALDAGGQLFSAIFSDDVTLDIGFRFSESLTPGAASTLLRYPYSVVRNALVLDSTSAADAMAASHLQAGPALDLLINLTLDNPHGVASATPYLDNDGGLNNLLIRMSASNAKGLGLDRAAAVGESIFAGGDLSRDAVIILNPNFLNPGEPWDFDRSDGIAGGHADFVGIVAHELAHVLGFSSGVDILDRSPSPQMEDEFTWINTLDLFRFSEASVAMGPGVIDWTANTTKKIFSIDGGVTAIANFATGINNGDGLFPGHWATLGTGIMDPHSTPFIGQEAQLSSADIIAIDVVGWNLVPEPSAWVLAVLGAISISVATWRSRGLAHRSPTT